ncbi:hypothetical protein BDR07DRAFT_1607980 [Suillus spraguei]|nr:hypothetical protein BDR07DRAFT_1607980 [Suillus spraguei]
MPELEMAYLTGTVFAAGTDTTTLAICTVLMVAACFHDEQRKVHEELNTVIGTDKELADPSTRIHWQEIASPPSCLHFGGPAMEAVGTYGDISRDPDVFLDPDTFKPDRWLDTKGRVRDDLKFFVSGFECVPDNILQTVCDINAVLILRVFRLTLDSTKPLDNMAFMNGTLPN